MLSLEQRTISTTNGIPILIYVTIDQSDRLLQGLY